MLNTKSIEKDIGLISDMANKRFPHWRNHHDDLTQEACLRIVKSKATMFNHFMACSFYGMLQYIMKQNHYAELNRRLIDYYESASSESSINRYDYSVSELLIDAKTILNKTEYHILTLNILGYSQPEIAEIAGVSIGYARSCKTNLIKKLRRCLCQTR